MQRILNTTTTRKAGLTYANEADNFAQTTVPSSGTNTVDAKNSPNQVLTNSLKLCDTSC